MTVKLTQPMARERVARALARMYSGNLSEQEVQQLSEWKEGDAEHRQEFLRTAHLLADMGGLQGSAKIQAILDESDNIGKGNNADRKFRHWPGVGIAAGIVVALILGFMLVGEPFSDNTSESDGSLLRYVTRVGEQKNVDLSDGSRIALNTGSELLVNLTDRERAVTLVRGEAFFEVATDPLRPFSVDVGARRISVLGTSFNIRKMPNQFSVAVVDGVVALHKVSESLDPNAPEFNTIGEKELRIDNPAQYRLTAGWVAEFDVDENFLVASLSKDPGGIYSWRMGLVRFAGAPFYQVVKELNRYSGKKILIEDSGLDDIEVYASVRVDRIDAALASLERAYPIKLVHYFDRIGIVSSNRGGNSR